MRENASKEEEEGALGKSQYGVGVSLATRAILECLAIDSMEYVCGLRISQVMILTG